MIHDFFMLFGKQQFHDHISFMINIFKFNNYINLYHMWLIAYISLWKELQRLIVSTYTMHI